MITDADIKKLKNSFKDTFATKDDLKELAKQKDLLRVESKVDKLELKVGLVEKRVLSVENKLDQLTEYVVPTLGGILKWTDDIHQAIVGKPPKTTHGN
jgi:hypothetical protein